MNKFSIVFITGADAVQAWWWNKSIWSTAPSNKHGNLARQAENEIRKGVKLVGDKQKSSDNLERLLDKADGQLDQIDRGAVRMAQALDNISAVDQKDIDTLLLQAQLAALRPAPTHSLPAFLPKPAPKLPNYVQNYKPTINPLLNKTRRGKNKDAVPQKMALPDHINQQNGLKDEIEGKMAALKRLENAMTGTQQTDLFVMGQKYQTATGNLVVGMTESDLDSTKLNLLALDGDLNNLAIAQLHSVDPLYRAKPGKGNLKNTLQVWKTKVEEAGQHGISFKALEAFAPLIGEAKTLATEYIAEMDESLFNKLFAMKPSHEVGKRAWQTLKNEYDAAKRSSPSKTIFETANSVENLHLEGELLLLDQSFESLLKKTLKNGVMKQVEEARKEYDFFVEFRKGKVNEYAATIEMNAIRLARFWEQTLSKTMPESKSTKKSPWSWKWLINFDEF